MTEEIIMEPETIIEMEMPASDKRYPIGPFQYQPPQSQEEVEQYIQTIAQFPERLGKLLEQYSEEDLEIPYRDGGWTVRQVVHHVADSHMNAYVRFKLALTEDKPTVKPYNEKLWAELDDTKLLPVEVSISLLAALHQRWVTLLNSMKPEDFNRSFFHPEDMRLHELSEILALYAWHSNHHLAHIKLVKPEKKKVAAKRTSAKKESSKKPATKKEPSKKSSKKKA